jgi:hypothetical protein
MGEGSEGMDYDRLDYWTDCLLAVLEKEEVATSGGEGAGNSGHDKELRSKFVQFRANAVVREAPVLVLQHLICGKWIVHKYHTFQAQAVGVCSQETGIMVKCKSKARTVQIALESIEPGDIFSESTAAEGEACRRRKCSQPSPDGVAEFVDFPEPADMATIKKQLSFERQSGYTEGTFLKDGGLSPALRSFLDSRQVDIPESRKHTDSSETLEMECSLIRVGLDGLIDQLRTTGIGGSSTPKLANASFVSEREEQSNSFLSEWTCPSFNFKSTGTETGGISSVGWAINCAQTYISATRGQPLLLLGSEGASSNKRDCSDYGVLLVQLFRSRASSVTDKPDGTLAAVVETICMMLGYSRLPSTDEQHSQARCVIHNTAMQTQHDVDRQLMTLYLQRILRTFMRKSAHLRQMRHSWNHWVLTASVVGTGGGLVRGGAALASAVTTVGSEIASCVGHQLNSWVANESQPAVSLSSAELSGQDHRYQSVDAMVDVCTFVGTGKALGMVMDPRSPTKFICQCFTTVYISTRVKHEVAGELEQLHPYVNVVEAGMRAGASLGIAALAELQQGLVETLFA